MRLLANLLLFQLGWFACVLGGAQGRPLLGASVAMLIVVVHLWRAPRRGAELRLILLAGLVGAILDSLPVMLGMVRYPSGTLVTGTAPYWLVAMWMLFATTLNVALRWLKGRWLLAVGLGALSGPLTYFGAARFGAITFVPPALVGLALLSLTWGVAMPILLWLADRNDGFGLPAADPR